MFKVTGQGCWWAVTLICNGSFYTLNFGDLPKERMKQKKDMFWLSSIQEYGESFNIFSVQSFPEKAFSEKVIHPRNKYFPHHWLKKHSMFHKEFSNTLDSLFELIQPTKDRQVLTLKQRRLRHAAALPAPCILRDPDSTCPDRSPNTWLTLSWC